MLNDNSENRYYGLDFFRIICMLVVFAFHSILHLGCNYGVFQDVLLMGAVFMTAFFMLSGFLMSLRHGFVDSISFNELVEFYKKRIITIMPLYWICSLLYILTQNNETTFRLIMLFPIETLGIQSFFSNSLFTYSHNSGTWFVSCLLFCYFCFPAIDILLEKVNIKIRCMVFGIIVGLILIGPYINAEFLCVTDLYTNPFYRLFEFCTGMILASCFKNRQEIAFIKNILKNKFVIAGLFAMYGVAVTKMHNLTWINGNYLRLNLIAVPIFSLLLIGCGEANFKRKHLIMKYASELSYCFFLAQLFSNWIVIFFLQRTGLGLNNISAILLAFLSCLIIAIFLHEIIERRMMKPVLLFISSRKGGNK